MYITKLVNLVDKDVHGKRGGMLEAVSERNKAKEENEERRRGEQRICTIYTVIYLWEHCRFEQNRTRAAETLVSHKIYETN